MRNKLLLGIATLVASRSRRLRWLVPVLPLAVGAYELYKRSRTDRPPTPAANPA